MKIPALMFRRLIKLLTTEVHNIPSGPSLGKPKPSYHWKFSS